MALSDLTVESVEQAIAEYDRLGGEAFRSRYGFGPARRYQLKVNDRSYDSKAIAGVAHGYATGTVLRAQDFSGGEASVGRQLERLGFEVHPTDTPLRPIDVVSFGEIPGNPVGTTFRTRVDAAQARVHRQRQAGICGTARTGAESIVVSGGYEDDEDLGDMIFYTGHGGQRNGKQVEDQSFTDTGNAALLTSKNTGRPVRVLRGADAAHRMPQQLAIATTVSSAS